MSDYRKTGDGDMSFRNISDTGLTHLWLTTRKRLYYAPEQLDVNNRCALAARLGEFEREMDRRNIPRTHLAVAQNDEHADY